MFPGCQQVSLASPREEKKFENFRLLARRFFFLPRSFFSFALPLSLPLSLPLRLEGKEETSTSFSLALTLSTTLSWSSMSLESSDASFIFFSRKTRGLVAAFEDFGQKCKGESAGKASIRALLIRGASQRRGLCSREREEREREAVSRERRGALGGVIFSFFFFERRWK